MTEVPIFRTLIVGCGAIAGGHNTPPLLNTHGGGIRAVPGLALVGCVDVDPIAARSFAQKFHTTDFTSISSAIELSRPDVVIVASSTESHRTVVDEVLGAPNSPKVIVLEKPAASNSEDYEKLLNTVSKSDALCLVNMTRRYSKNILKIGKTIDSQALGNPARVFCTYYGGLWNNGVHLIDFLDMLFSSTLENIEITGVVPSRFDNDPSVEFSASVASNGAEVSVRAIDESHFQAFEVDVWFSDGRVEVFDFGQRVQVSSIETNGIGERVLSSRLAADETSTFGQTVPLYEAIDNFLRRGEPFEFPSLEINYHDHIMGQIAEIYGMSQKWRT